MVLPDGSRLVLRVDTVVRADGSTTAAVVAVEEEDAVAAGGRETQREAQ